ncbi:hypothetical protein [Actinomadura sp. NPDC000929]|uniref:hypothetical protein n=1 Tax=Actinomadura sp. NPDC000929 TaxID=3154517 RepID=UPI0033934EF9
MGLLLSEASLTGGAPHDLLAARTWRAVKERVAEVETDIAAELLIPPRLAHAHVLSRSGRERLLDLAHSDDPVALIAAEVAEEELTLKSDHGIHRVTGRFSNPVPVAARVTTLLGRHLETVVVHAVADGRWTFIAWRRPHLAVAGSCAMWPGWRVSRVPPSAIPESRLIGGEAPPRAGLVAGPVPSGGRLRRRGSSWNGRASTPPTFRGCFSTTDHDGLRLAQPTGRGSPWVTCLRGWRLAEEHGPFPAAMEPGEPVSGATAIRLPSTYDDVVRAFVQVRGSPFDLDRLACFASHRRGHWFEPSIAHPCFRRSERCAWPDLVCSDDRFVVSGASRGVNPYASQIPEALTRAADHLECVVRARSRPAVKAARAALRSLSARSESAFSARIASAGCA